MNEKIEIRCVEMVRRNRDDMVDVLKSKSHAEIREFFAKAGKEARGKSRRRKETEPERDGGWQHTRIVLSALNRGYKPIVIPEAEAESFRILAEFVAVLRGSE